MYLMIVIPYLMLIEMLNLRLSIFGFWQMTKHNERPNESDLKLWSGKPHLKRKKAGWKETDKDRQQEKEREKSKNI